MERTESDSTLSSLAVKLIALVVLIMFVAPIAIQYFYGKPGGPGIFGDMFGSINALFSGLAFIGVIFAILLQRQELGLQRKELEQTREELKGQKEQLKAQNETFRLQSFENTFFQLVRLHNDIVNSIDIVREETANLSAVAKGRDCFAGFYAAFRTGWNKEVKDSQGIDAITIINNAYRPFIRRHESDLDPYFRNLYTILRFLKDSQIGNKAFYSEVIRALISRVELLVLFYHCLCDEGTPELKALVEEFGILKDVQVDVLQDPSHTKLYRPSAFGDHI